MIGTTLADYIFIRACIIGLQSIAPLSIICCLTSLLSCFITFPISFTVPLPLKVWAAVEVIFYIFVSLVYQEKLQHEALHPPAPTRKDRKELFDLCNHNIPDIEAYLNKWFLGAPLDEIKRENLKEFFLWAFWNRDGPPGTDDEELEEYVIATENLLGREIKNGRGSAVCLRLTIDRASMSYRSIVWYLCVGFVDFLACTRLQYYGFTFRRTAFPRFLMIFPIRPLTLFKSSRSPARRLTYWYRPHTSRSRRPVLFIHGIGIGLYPYVNFLAQLDSALNLGRSSKDQVGIVAVEIMPVSFRITHSALRSDEMCEEIQALMRHHGFDRPVLVSHSYGTVITTQLLKSPMMASSVGPVVLIDPISILLHLPDVAYNFTHRKPKRANEYQLHYFASMDMGVSHSLSRCFFWSENVLWKHEIGHRPMTVSLAGRDLIVDTKTVGNYLASHNDELAPDKKESVDDVAALYLREKLGSQHASEPTPEEFLNGHAPNGTLRTRSFKTIIDASSEDKGYVQWRDRAWVGKGLDLIWFHTLDHAQVFDNARNRQPLIDAIKGYSAQPY